MKSLGKVGPLSFGSSLKRVLVVVAAVVSSGCGGGQEMREAREAAIRIHQEFGAGNFAAIYHEAAPHFKKQGENDFVTSMERIRQEYGTVQKVTITAYQSRFDSEAGRTHVIVSDLEFAQTNATERIFLIRDRDGQMRLWDLIIEAK